MSHKSRSTQIFPRLGDAFQAGNAVAKDILESYAQAEFFTKLPDVPEEIQVVSYVAGEGDISTDLLSPGNQAHSRSDRELHGKCLISPEAQSKIKALQKLHPDKSVMLVAEKGTMDVGSSRMSGVNNVALWTGKPGSPYVPFVNIATIVAGTNGISLIFLTTVDVTGGIGLDLQNWVKKKDADGSTVTDEDGEPVLEQAYSVETGTILTINSKSKKLLIDGKEVHDIAKAFTPQKVEFMKAGGSYAIVFGKKLQTFAAKTLGIEAPVVFSPAKEISHKGQGLTAVEKIFNRNVVGSTPGVTLERRKGTGNIQIFNVATTADRPALQQPTKKPLQKTDLDKADWEATISFPYDEIHLIHFKGYRLPSNIAGIAGLCQNAAHRHTKPASPPPLSPATPFLPDGCPQSPSFTAFLPEANS